MSVQVLVDFSQTAHTFGLYDRVKFGLEENPLRGSADPGHTFQVGDIQIFLQAQ